jgi:hypothetical protein
VFRQIKAKNPEQIGRQIACFRGFNLSIKRRPIDRVKLHKPMHYAAGFGCNVSPPDRLVIFAARRV